jgi:hypothetical protein
MFMVFNQGRSSVSWTWCVCIRVRDFLIPLAAPVSPLLHLYCPVGIKCIVCCPMWIHMKLVWLFSPQPGTSRQTWPPGDVLQVPQPALNAWKSMENELRYGSQRTATKTLMQQAEEFLLFQRKTFIHQPNNSESTSQCWTGLHKQAMVYIQKKCRTQKSPFFIS